VTEGLPALRPDHFIPHLYRPEELARIERASRMAIGQVHTPARRLCRWSRHAAFGLMSDCGLRVSEACRLVLEDYDPKARSLRIERTKFEKTRVIPLPRSTACRLDRYLRHRLRMARDCPDLFVTTYGRRPKRNALEDPFRQMLRELGLYKPKQRQGRTVFGSTNLHALRHSFAVRTLERWQRQRRDVEALLPLLSGYMGHDQVSYTATYLHLTPRLRQLASERFGELVLPSLDRRGRDGSEE
jgi:integrase